jgi:hypothetical protein
MVKYIYRTIPFSIQNGPNSMNFLVKCTLKYVINKSETVSIVDNNIRARLKMSKKFVGKYVDLR